jgi:hypothetical protein
MRWTAWTCGTPLTPRCGSRDENGRKNLISTFVSIFLAEMGLGSEIESEYAGVRKRTNAVKNSTKMVKNREPKPEYRTSLYLYLTELGRHT